MARKPILVVMAAGMGSRYGGLKQIDPVGSKGEAILDYSIYDAYEAGFETAVIIIKESIQKDFMETVGRRLEKSPVKIRYAFQEQNMLLPAGMQIPAERGIKPWGTGHAILCAKEEIGDAPFAVINSDDYYGKSAFKAIYKVLCQARDGEKLDCSMMGYHLGNTVSDNGTVTRGICEMDDGGYLTSIVERQTIARFEDGIRYTEDGETWVDLAPDTLVSMNMFGFTPGFLKELERKFPEFLEQEMPLDPARKEFLLPTIAGALLQEGRCRFKVLPSGDRWYGVTYAADKPKVVAALKAMTGEGKYPDGLWE